MDVSFAIASSALQADMTEIDVASENIANAQSPGYLEEQANLAATPPAELNGAGSGVEVTGISQASNSMLSANNWQAQGALSGLASLQQVLTGIQDIFPIGESASSSSSTNATNTSIGGQLASFWSAWDAVANDPSATAPRTNVVDLAEGIVTTLQEGSTQLSQLSQNSAGALSDDVTQLNNLLGQAASLNGQIVTTSGSGGSPNQLEDQLNNVLGEISSLANVNIHPETNGTSTISLGGVTLVQSDSANSLLLEDTGGTYSLATGGGKIAVPVSGGSISGLLAGLNQYIPDYSNQLDSVASTLASTVNSQLASGYTGSGVSGSGYPLFTGSTASTIGVNAALVADPSLIAAASTNGPAGVNDGSNAQSMAELASSTTGPDANYQTLVQSIGATTENVNTQVTAQSSVANQAQTTLQAATGVDLNTELTNLMTFQSSYQAAAKLLGVIDSTTAALMAAI